MKHIHHIVPRHMGGTDDPSNLVEVTIEQHAELHFALYLEHGKYEDYIAYNMLAGKTSEGERVLNILRSEYMTNRVVSQQTRDKMTEYNKIRVHTEESRRKRSEKMSGDNNPFAGKTHDYNTRKAISQAARNQWEKTKYIWVTNGLETRRVAENSIPKGFVKGRKINKLK